MGPRHASAVVLVLLALVASLLSLGATAASAAPRTAAPSPKAAVQPRAVLSPRAATVGRPPRNYVIPRTSYFSYPTGSYAAKVQIRNRVLYTVQSVWGGPRTSHRPAAREQRQDPDGHLVLQRHDHGQGPGRRPQPRRQRADHGGCHRQHRFQALEVPPAPPGCPPLPPGPPGDQGHLQLRPPVPRLVPGLRRGAALEVLPVRQRRGEPSPRHRRPGIDEPHRVRGQRPVEPGAGAEVACDRRQLPWHLPPDEPGPPRGPPVQRHDLRQRGRLLLPAPGRQLVAGPGDADC